jgi:hypothetical protein
MIGGHDLNNALLVHFRAVANETGAFFFLINGKFNFFVFYIIIIIKIIIIVFIQDTLTSL